MWTGWTTGTQPLGREPHPHTARGPGTLVPLCKHCASCQAVCLHTDSTLCLHTGKRPGESKGPIRSAQTAYTMPGLTGTAPPQQAGSQVDQGTEVALAPGEPVQGRKAGPGLCRTARWGSRQEACVSCRGAPPSIQHHCWGTELMCSPGPWQVCGPLCAKKQLPLGSCPQYQVEERERPTQARWTGGRQSE